jgi:hypothetical protein
MVVDALLEADPVLRITDKIRSPAEFQLLDDGLLDVRGGWCVWGCPGFAANKLCNELRRMACRHPSPPPPSHTQVVENFELFGRLLNLEPEHEAPLRSAQAIIARLRRRELYKCAAAACMVGGVWWWFD